MQILMLCFLVFTMPLCALYNGNPSLPDMPERGVTTAIDDWWSIKIGYEIDKTFSKRVKVKDRVSSVKDLFDQYKSYKQLGIFTFNIIDRFEIYGLLGSMKLTMAQRPIDSVRLEYETDSQMVWGIGGRVVLVYWEEVIMGFNARYNASCLSIKRIMQNGMPRNSNKSSLHYHEWQVGMGFSREINSFIPYIGLAYASMFSCLKNLPSDSAFSFNPYEEDLQNRSPFIFLLGVGVTEGIAVDINIEARMVGEVALTVSADLRF